MPLFLKTVVHFGFLPNEMECEMGKQRFSNKVIVFNSTSHLIFEYEFQRILYNWSFSITAKANLLNKSPICSP